MFQPLHGNPLEELPGLDYCSAGGVAAFGRAWTKA